MNKTIKFQMAAEKLNALSALQACLDEVPSRRFSDQMDRHVEAVIEIMSLPQPRTYELIRLIQVQQSYSAALAQFTEPGLTYLLEEMGEALRTAIEDALADLHEARAEMYLMHSQGDAT